MKPHSFCETPEQNCTMNHCDENGCLNRKRELIDDHIVDTNEMVDQVPDVRKMVEEDDELRFIKKQLENIEHYKLGYNAAQNKLYTEEQVTQAMLEMCEYIIDAFERRYLIDANEKAKDIIKSLKLE